MQLPVGVCLYLRATCLLKNAENNVFYLFFWNCGLILTTSYSVIMHHVFSWVCLSQWVSVTIVIALSSSHTEKCIWVDLLNLLNFKNYNSRKRGQMLEPTKGEKNQKRNPPPFLIVAFFPCMCQCWLVCLALTTWQPGMSVLKTRSVIDSRDMKDSWVSG